MKEATVEYHFCSEVNRRGGLALKLVGYLGMPDRLAIMPGGVCLFAEIKRPRGGRVSAAQRHRIAWLIARGHRACVLKTKEEVDECLAEWPTVQPPATPGV
jgi:hypothetical protein